MFISAMRVLGKTSQVVAFSLAMVLALISFRSSFVICIYTLVSSISDRRLPPVNE